MSDNKVDDKVSFFIKTDDNNCLNISDRVLAPAIECPAEEKINLSDFDTNLHTEFETKFISKNISRKKFRKKLMAKGFQRNVVNAIADYVFERCGCYPVFLLICFNT